MAFGITEQQLQLSDQILQIMNDKGRQTVERIELVSFEQRVRQPSRMRDN